MIAWAILLGMLCIAITLPARLFGWVCGLSVRYWLHDRKPPIRPPI